MKLRKTARGIFLDVYVKPSSKEFQIKTEEDELVVFCRETPVKGRVNRELIREIEAEEVARAIQGECVKDGV